MILIGLGSNLTTADYQTSQAILDAAITALADAGVKVMECSPYYETEPVPKSDQPWFINAVASVKSSLNAAELLKTLHDIEHNLGRVRRKKWEARIIDLDLLAYDDLILPHKAGWQKFTSDNQAGVVVVPHPRMHQRDFVLIPLAKVAPGWQHPILAKSVETLLKEQKSDGIVRLL